MLIYTVRFVRGAIYQAIANVFLHADMVEIAVLLHFGQTGECFSDE